MHRNQQPVLVMAAAASENDDSAAADALAAAMDDNDSSLPGERSLNKYAPHHIIAHSLGEKSFCHHSHPEIRQYSHGYIVWEFLTFPQTPLAQTSTSCNGAWIVLLDQNKQLAENWILSDI